jgi:hypothetical protein
MTRLASIVCAVVVATAVAPFGGTALLAGQAPPELRTPWGHPDLRGLWTNSTITPLERPAAYAGREFLTIDEVRALDAAAAERYDRRSSDRAADLDAAYNQVWWERGRWVASRRTSLVIDPPDGKIPELTPEGKRRAAAAAAILRGVPRGPEDRNLAERCITRGAPKLPGGYNNNFEIVQTPTHVAILQEMIHEARIIPLDGRPHLPAGIGLWLGDSRGRWEGETLVVETKNYHPLSLFNSYYCCRGAAKDLRITERFRRTDARTIDHQFTVEDPTTFTRPYTVAVPMTKFDGPIFEYACHEANYGMAGILRGSRAEERNGAERPQ